MVNRQYRVYTDEELEDLKEHNLMMDRAMDGKWGCHHERTILRLIATIEELRENNEKKGKS